MRNYSRTDWTWLFLSRMYSTLLITHQHLILSSTLFTVAWDTTHTINNYSYVCLTNLQLHILNQMKFGMVSLLGRF